jgi:hypothetical protein
MGTEVEGGLTWSLCPRRTGWRTGPRCCRSQSPASR